MRVFSRLFTEKFILKRGILHKIKNEMLQKCSNCASPFGGTPSNVDVATLDSSASNPEKKTYETRKRKRTKQDTTQDCEALKILCK